MQFYKGQKMLNNFDYGYDSWLNALEALSLIKENPDHEMLAGLLSSIMNCIYYYAPSEKAANDLVKFAVDFAISENQKIGMYLPKGA